MADQNNGNGYVQVGDPFYYQPNYTISNVKTPISGECQACSKRSSSNPNLWFNMNDLNDCHILLGEWKRNFTLCAACGEQLVTSIKKILKDMLKEP